MARKKPKKKTASGRRRGGGPRLRLRLRWRRSPRVWLGLGTALLVLGGAIFLHLWVAVTSRFDGRLWSHPDRVYSDVLTLEAGDPVGSSRILERLDRGGYARVSGEPTRPGQYRSRVDGVEVFRRQFPGPAGPVPAERLVLTLRGGRVGEIRDENGRRRERAVLEPELLATLYGARQEERSVVGIAQVPESMIGALLAAEDRRFFDHHGLDLRGILRAAAANARAGRIVQGGSTITQQTVKNLYLDQRRTWWRKLREVLMAAILDGRYPKERILEVYVNEVYLGQRGSVAICGLQAASRFYFGRDLADLDLGEQALLAGMIRSPGGYNPFRHPERAAARRDQVLAAMVDLGATDENEAARARAEPLRLASGRGGFREAPYAVDFARRAVEARWPGRAEGVEGLRIHTTIDTFVQQTAERALVRGLERLEAGQPAVRKQLEQRRLQGVVLVLRPADGAVLAVVGGRDHGATQFNRATQARRQPGSCFKPFVFAAGFEMAVAGDPAGFLPSTRLEDSPLRIEAAGRVWEPGNYDRKFRGMVTARRALEDSLNVPTVRAARQVGVPRVAEVARRCGIRSALAEVPSLALGTSEVTPLELAESFATFSRGGEYLPAFVVQSLADEEGAPLEVAQPAVPVRGLSAGATEMLDDVLRGVFREGTARSARQLGYSGVAAGKTGTTDDYRDAWFVGYTDRYLVLVWVGYDDNARTGLTGASGALPLWVEVMQALDPDGMSLRRRPADRLIRVRIDPESGQRATRHCPRVIERTFVRGSEPRERCRLHEGRFRRWLRGVFGGDDV